MTDSSLSSRFLWRHLASPQARGDAGRSRQGDFPLESHAGVETANRPDPIDILAAQDVNRLAELVPIRYGRMSRTPFTFLRGSAAVMAADLATGPSTDINVQLCGDAHLSNFGLFHSPDRRLIFDVNDFDETLHGPFEWDLKRLAASVTVASRQNEFSAKKARRATLAALGAYRRTMREASELGPLDLFYYRLEAEGIAERFDTTQKQRKASQKAVRKATRKDSSRALSKLTDIVDGRRIIVPDPPLIVRFDVETGEQIERIDRFFSQYRQTLPAERRALLDRFSIVDIAHKVVGVGSVGTRCVVILLESADGQPLFLQFKEASASVLEPYAGPCEFAHHGERVVEGQRLTQAASDVFLGWATSRSQGQPEVDFYFRQLWDGKASAEVEEMGPGGMRRYAALCGIALALAHARSGDAAMIDGYLGDDETLDQAVADFSESYADITQSDHTKLTEAITEGRVQVIDDL